MSFGKKVKSDPRVFAVIDGKIYLNKNQSLAKRFSKNTASLIGKADVEWEKIEMALKEKAEAP